VAHDGVRAREDGNSVHTAQQHVMDEHRSRRYFLERDEDKQRGSRPVGPVAHRPKKAASGPVRLSYESYFFSELTTFFSHNKNKQYFQP
jgi:hypothetical protein